MTSQLTDQETSLVHSVLAQVEPSPTYLLSQQQSTTTTQSISSNQSFIQAIEQLCLHIKQLLSSSLTTNKEHSIQLYQFLSHQLQMVVVDVSGHNDTASSFDGHHHHHRTGGQDHMKKCNVELIEVILKIGQVLLRLPHELWSVVFHEALSSDLKIATSGGIYHVWLLNEIGAQLNIIFDMIESSNQENDAAVSSVVLDHGSKLMKVLGNLVLLFSGCKIKVNHLVQLYPLHNELFKMCTRVFGMKNVGMLEKRDDDWLHSIKVQCNRWMNRWFDYLSSHVHLSVTTNTTALNAGSGDMDAPDHAQGDYLVFVCKSIVDMLPVASADCVNSAWKALLMLTCEHPSHIALIKKKLAVGNSSMMDIPKMLGDWTIGVIQENLRGCYEMLSNGQSSQNSSSQTGNTFEANLKLARFYLQNFTSLLSHYSEHLLLKSPKQLAEMFILSFKYALLVPPSYCDRRSKDYQKIKLTLQSGMEQVNVALTKMLSMVLSNTPKRTCCNFIHDYILVELKDVYDITAQVFIIAVIIAKYNDMDDVLEIKMFTTLFEKLARSHPGLLQHTECETTTLSPYQKVDNYLSMFYSFCATKKKQNNVKIQNLLWGYALDLSKTNLTRRLALDSLTFLFCNSINANKYQSWTQICDHMIETQSSNLFMNGDGYIDEYDWLVWMECLSPLLERFGLAVLDEHQFISFDSISAITSEWISKCAVIPRVVIQEYLVRHADKIDPVYSLCGDMLKVELSRSSYEEVTGSLFSIFTVLSHMISCERVQMKSATENTVNEICEQLLSPKCLKTMFRSADYRVIVGAIDFLSSCVERFSASTWMKQYIPQVLKWFIAVWDMNNPTHRVSIIGYIARMSFADLDITSNLQTNLHTIIQKMLTAPTDTATKMEWIQFLYAVDSVKAIIQASPTLNAEKLSSMIPGDVTEYFDYSAKRAPDSSIFVPGNYFEDHMPSRREDVVGQKRKREFSDFSARQAERRKKAASAPPPQPSLDTNNLLAIIDNARNALQICVTQPNAIPENKGKIVSEQAQQLSSIINQMVTLLNSRK